MNRVGHYLVKKNKKNIAFKNGIPCKGIFLLHVRQACAFGSYTNCKYYILHICMCTTTYCNSLLYNAV